MKLMHIISSLEQGGAQAVLYDVVKQLQKKGYRQTIIYMHEGPYRERFTTLNVPLQKISGLITTFDPICFARLVMFMRRERPDCVHTVLWAANWLGRAAARFLSIRCVTSLHNNYDQNGRMRILLDQLISYKKCRLIAVSKEVQQSFADAYHNKWLPSIIVNGIDVHAVQQAAQKQKKMREALRLTSDDFVIGSVGRFHPIKRYDFLLDAFVLVHKKHPNARLLLVGSGPQESFLRDYAKQLGIESYVRWIIGESAYGYYSLFNCFILSSKKEGISIALLEAMSLGIVPIVSYHIVQHPVITHLRNGYVASAKNATSFADQISICVTSPQKRMHMAKSAQQTIVNRFAHKVMIAAYDRTFRRK